MKKQKHNKKLSCRTLGFGLPRMAIWWLPSTHTYRPLSHLFYGIIYDAKAESIQNTKKKKICLEEYYLMLIR